MFRARTLRLVCRRRFLQCRSWRRRPRIFRPVQREDLAAKPTGVDGWRQQGRRLLECHRYEAAVESFGEALALDPQHVETLTECGMALASIGRLDEALATYEKALAIKPHDSGAL